MDVKVLKTFRNKYSKNIHREGEIIEIPEKRFEEINSTSFGILVEGIKEEKEIQKKTTKK